MERIRKFFQDNALMVSGMLLMLASAGVDGKFLSMWMSDGMQWLGYVLNLVGDASGYVMSNAYGRLQNDEDENKRKLSRFLLVGEFVNIAYSWLFSFLVLRDRFVVFFTRPIFGNVNLEVEILAFLSAGFVPLSLVFLGYADSLNKTQTKKRQVNVKKSVNAVSNTEDILQPVETQTSNFPLPVDKAREAKAQGKQERIDALLNLYRQDSMLPVSSVAQSLQVSRQTVTSYLSELETTGQIKRNGHGVEILTLEG